MMPDDTTMTIPLPYAARNTDATPSSSIDAASTKMRNGANAKKIRRKRKKKAETKREKNK